ncbi:hypothetical protein G4B88_014532 [Cannabis sativa]|uniref:Ubiquitin-like protease family profile domain-containing protein n=1 Tax=Cannabis sativa TaxID=3483 RepID=A0A7J6I9W4_CANSA|nr:hypothetical protein G4B88_014532 [Cannabis sativa]
MEGEAEKAIPSTPIDIGGAVEADNASRLDFIPSFINWPSSFSKCKYLIVEALSVGSWGIFQLWNISDVALFKNRLRTPNRLFQFGFIAIILACNSKCLVNVIGNKWDTYLDLLQADYSEGELILTEEKLHSSNNSKGKEKCKGKEKIVEHLDSTKSYEKFIAEVLDKTHISLQAICIWENLNQRQKELYKFYDVELLSYNNEQDKHWMLIIAMTSGRVVFLNPLKSKIPSDIAQMIKAAYANISSNAIVFGKNGPEIWTFACPKQPYNYECGYYVLTYIRDMLQHLNPIEAIKAKFGGLSQYSEDDHLLPLRQQWLNNA